jgi:hypothetical protein
MGGGHAAAPIERHFHREHSGRPEQTPAEIFLVGHAGGALHEHGTELRVGRRNLEEAARFVFQPEVERRTRKIVA